MLRLRNRVTARQAELDAWVWDGGRVLITKRAAAALRRSQLHPTRTWLALAVGPEARPDDLAPLVAEARRLANQPLKLRTWDQRLLDALRTIGAQDLIKSHLVSLDRGDHATAAWMANAIPFVVTDRMVDDARVADAAWDRLSAHSRVGPCRY